MTLLWFKLCTPLGTGVTALQYWLLAFKLRAAQWMQDLCEISFEYPLNEVYRDSSNNWVCERFMQRRPRTSSHPTKRKTYWMSLSPHRASICDDGWNMAPLFHFINESTRLSEWFAYDESDPNGGKTAQSVGKIMTSIFWDVPGLIWNDYRKKRKAINYSSNRTFLEDLKIEFAEKRSLWRRRRRKTIPAGKKLRDNEKVSAEPEAYFGEKTNSTT